MQTWFHKLCSLLQEIERTSKRTFMVDAVASFLVTLISDEVEPAVTLILGRAFPKWSHRTLEVRWATLRRTITRLTKVDWTVFREVYNQTGDVGEAVKKLVEASKLEKQTTLSPAPLTILGVRRSFEAIADAKGRGSREQKERLLETLLSEATPFETKFLVRILLGDMRVGFHEGLMELAVSKAWNIPHETVQHAAMMAGDIGEIAAKSKVGGEAEVSKISFALFRPFKPMLAQTAPEPVHVLDEGEVAFEYKLDGARIQIHKGNSDVKIYSRRLTDVTQSLPEIVKQVKNEVKAAEAILEGEVIAVGEEGAPLPFQFLMRRFRRTHDIQKTQKAIPVQLHLFDLISLNGENIAQQSYVKRREKLAQISGKINLVKQTVTRDPKQAAQFFSEAIDRGHEGVVAKKLQSTYTPGIRGKKWFKIKKTLDPLDLVIVAAEYGYGRRHKWLSDYYLAAREPQKNTFTIVGKTFKGLSDNEIIQMTQQLKKICTREEHGKVHVRPEIVVEVLFNEVQKSRKYRSGVTLRFARITRIRPDKPPEEADTIQTVLKLYEKQFEKKAKFSE